MGALGAQNTSVHDDRTQPTSLECAGQFGMFQELMEAMGDPAGPVKIADITWKYMSKHLPSPPFSHRCPSVELGSS